MRGGLTAPLAVLDRRLAHRSRAPLTLAFSGGGDSLALLLMTADWARARGRDLHVLTVDHHLNPASAQWTQACERTAARLGLVFQALHWTGNKPTSGLQATARGARHTLIADAARAAGAHVVLMGHTADDRIEAAAMRAAGSTVPDPREWAPSPVWPEGRNLFLLRPLLSCRRADLRAWLQARGEDWIDDPANMDPRHTRSRVRKTLGDAPPEPLKTDTPPAPIALSVASVPAAGVLALPRTASPRAIAVAALCASGTSRPPRGDRLARLVEALAQPGDFTTTLSGARIEAGSTQIVFIRDAGEVRRGGLATRRLPPGEPVVWDGRFELTALKPGLSVQLLAGLANRLAKPERLRLSNLPPAARRALPAIVDDAGGVSCPVFAEAGLIRVNALAAPRFGAATGAVLQEPAV